MKDYLQKKQDFEREKCFAVTGATGKKYQSCMDKHKYMCKLEPKCKTIKFSWLSLLQDKRVYIIAGITATCILISTILCTCRDKLRCKKQAKIKVIPVEEPLEEPPIPYLISEEYTEVYQV